MNLKQINEILSSQNLNMNDIARIANKFSNLNLKDENQMHEIILEISHLVKRDINKQDEKKIIEMIHQTKL